MGEINNFVRYPDLNEAVSNAMQQCDNKETARYIAEFLRGKKEKYTYNTEKGRYYISSFFPTFPSDAWNRLVSGVDKIVNQKKRIPLQADIVVTGTCHCKCWHCFRSKYEPGDMSLDKIKECMNSLFQLGTATVGITGGEPMLRPDIMDIIESIPCGMEGQLFTTGYGIDDLFARKLKDTNLTRCIISLDHYEESVSCKLRNNPDAFKDALRAIKVLTGNNIYTAVTVCVNNELLKEGALQKYFEFIATLGVQEVRVIMPIPQGNLEGSAVGRFYGKAMGIVKQLKKENLLNGEFPAIINFCELESADYIGCGAGCNYISVNNDGNITPCVAVPLSFGNIFENSLENIYNEMGKVFAESDSVCFGIASGTIIKRENIDTNLAPLSADISFEIAKKCRSSTQRAALFEYIASKGAAKERIFNEDEY